MSDTPLLYGSYSPNMYPIVPDGIENVSHNSRGKEKINPEKIYKNLNQLLANIFYYYFFCLINN